MLCSKLLDKKVVPASSFLPELKNDYTQTVKDLNLLVLSEASAKKVIDAAVK